MNDIHLELDSTRPYLLKIHVQIRTFSKTCAELNEEVRSISLYFPQQWHLYRQQHSMGQDGIL